ncbi:MAG: nucleotide exchange factor GrpE [Clostridia bacterium]|nr:nucleotide exchange factor GrpE [Clostridia bacterium]
MSEIEQAAAGTPEAENQPAPEVPDTVPAETPAAEADPVEQLQQALAEAQAKADEYLTLAQRVQADFDNFRKRNATVRADGYQEGQRDVAAAMLEVLDNLERALSLAEEGTPLYEGLSLTFKQMSAAYEKLGVTPIERTGEKFDPNLENAVMQGTAEEGEPGTVCQVFQKGYRMGDRVLRHALVKVVAE